MKFTITARGKERRVVVSGGRGEKARWWYLWDDESSQVKRGEMMSDFKVRCTQCLVPWPLRWLDIKEWSLALILDLQVGVAGKDGQVVFFFSCFSFLGGGGNGGTAISGAWQF